MNFSGLPLLAAVATLAVALPAAAEIRLDVSNKSLGSQNEGETRSSQRQLVIAIDNRDREAHAGATLEWTIIARDINSRKLSIAGRGSRQIDIPAKETIEVNSDPFSLAKTDGKVHRINENRPDLEQFKADPDSGTRYAGYIVVLKQGDVILAEAATAGMKNRIKDLQPPTQK